MKRYLAVALIVLAAACGDDDDNGPNGPTPPNNTGPIVFTAQLSPANEVPAITGPEASGSATGTITFNVPRDPNTGAVTGGGSAVFTANMTGFPAGTVIRLAHIHTGAAGTPGPIFVDSTLSPAAAITLTNGSGTLNLTQSNLTQDQATQVVANPAGFYYNIHSNLNPGGVVRGQLVRQ